MRYPGFDKHGNMVDVAGRVIEHEPKAKPANANRGDFRMRCITVGGRSVVEIRLHNGWNAYEHFATVADFEAAETVIGIWDDHYDGAPDADRDAWEREAQSRGLLLEGTY